MFNESSERYGNRGEDARLVVKDRRCVVAVDFVMGGNAPQKIALLLCSRES